jgi:hypothetical protein
METALLAPFFWHAYRQARNYLVIHSLSLIWILSSCFSEEKAEELAKLEAKYKASHHYLLIFLFRLLESIWKALF